LKKLTGNTDIEDSLERLDQLTQEEARMASAELLKMTHSVDDRVKSVEGKVEDVRSDVHDVGNKVEGRVQDVDHKVQSIDSDIKCISSGIQGVDDKLDQVNRSLFFQTLVVIPRAQTGSQGTSSEIVSYDGFRPRIHPSTITSHAKPITTAQLNGFSKEIDLIGGNLLAPSCGYTKNVCYS
jgi:hypothetical protein